MAFLNCNNPAGFVKEQEEKELGYVAPPLVYKENARKIVDILIDVSDRHLITHERLREYGAELRKASGRRDINKHGRAAHKAGVTRFGIPLYVACNLVAQAMGYSTFNEARNSQTVITEGNNPVILNKRKKGEFKAEFFPDLQSESNTSSNPQ